MEHKIESVLSEEVSLRSAAVLGMNALHECIVPKGAETQISDAMRALRSAIDNDTLQQAVLAGGGAVRDQALQEAAAKMDARYNAVTGKHQYDKGRRDAYDVAESDILALKGTHAAAVADSQEVSVLAAALALLVAGGFVSQEKASEAIQIALHTPGAAGLPANDPPPSSNPGPLAAVELSDEKLLDVISDVYANARHATYHDGERGVRVTDLTIARAAIAASKEGPSRP